MDLDLELKTGGGGEATVDSKNGQVSKPTQSDCPKVNPLGSDDRKQSPSDAETIQQQLQQNLTRQQALTIDSFHGSFDQRALMNSLLSQYSLEQLLRFASERPDLVNEETIQEFVWAQITDMSEQLVHNDNQRDLLYTQLQAAMMTGGHFNPTQLPVGMQEIAAVAEPIQSQPRGSDASGEADDGPSGSQIGQSTFMSSVDESPYMKVLEEYKKQGVGNQDQAALQKKTANEAKRASLAQKQKLSIHLSSNEADASTSTAERSKIDKKRKSSGEPSSDSDDSTERVTAAPPDKKGGDKEIKDKKKSPRSSKNDAGARGSDSSRVGDSPNTNIGTDASSKVEPKGQPHAIPPQTPQSVAASVPVAGLQQGLTSLQEMDPFQQAILQHAMVNANAPHQLHLSQSYGGGTASEIPGNAFRLQQQLISQEYCWLQQLRQTLQTQALRPNLNMEGFGVSLPNNMLNQLAAKNAFAGAGGLANSLMQQNMNNNNQELLLQHALALLSNQNALMGGVLQSPVANNEQIRMAAQRQGIDAGTLAQLLMIWGETSQPPSSPPKRD